MSKQIKVALVGQPNVGKSHLVNSISGAHLHVGNFTGVTVEKKEVKFERDGYEIIITDLPGTYSLNSYSPDEQVTKDFLFKETYDIVVNVLDANALQRNLSLTLQLLDMGKKTILAINMIDEVEKNGGKIDNEEISKMLGVPALLVSAKEKRGVDELIKKILEMYEFGKNENRLTYDQNIDEAITELSNSLAKDSDLKPYAKFAAIRLLENDKEMYRIVHDKPVFLEFHDVFTKTSENLRTLAGEDDTPTVMANAKISIAKWICQRAVIAKHKETLTERIDKVLIHRLLGLPIFLALMWLLFQATFTLGEYPMGLIEEAFTFLSEQTAAALPEGTFNSAMSEGVIPSIGAIMGFLPNILILFLGINLLEQTGYMARAAFLLDGILKKFGLHGKAFIPMVTGFGCSIPAYLAARTLKNPKDKLITMLVIGFFSCSARLPVYVLFISAFFAPEQAGNILFGIYIGGAVLAMIAAKILRLALFKGEAEPFVMEMPKYRFPSIKGVLRDLKIKAMIFIKKAGLFIGTASMAIWFLGAYPANEQIDEAYAPRIEAAVDEAAKKELELALAEEKLENSYIGTVGKAIEPIFSPLGFDWKMSVATVTALAAKEVAVGTLATLNAVEAGDDEPSESLVEKIRKSIDIKAGLAFIVLVMIYSPCLAAIGTFFAEVRETKWRIFYLVYPNVTAWLAAFSVYNIAAIFGL
ncbi:MAG: ferrous iron transport protein B [Campylobacterales bacterium]